MSTTDIPHTKPGGTRKTIIRLAKRVVPLAIATLLFPKVLAFWAACGLLDIVRNRQLDLQLFSRYFLGNGLLTWLLAPFNLLMDLLSLPYWNKGIFRLEDLPDGHQAEIKSLIAAAERHDLTKKLQQHVTGRDRSMIFFKWYGKDVETALDVPEFHQEYKYIRTIGVSVFNKRKSTSEHFGPLRVTYRILYNINDIEDPKAFIQVGNHINRWSDNKLFIFDDMLLHKSCNETDTVRYCMFIDILRPSLFPGLMSTILAGLRLVLGRVNFLFYGNWDFIELPPTR